MNDLPQALRIELGPITFQYWPDGDDPGVGQLEVLTKGDHSRQQISTDDWNEFVKPFLVTFT